MASGSHKWNGRWALLVIIAIISNIRIGVYGRLSKFQCPINENSGIEIRIRTSPIRLVNIVIILLPAALGVW